MSARTKRKIVWLAITVVVVVFLTWRMIRPMNIFVVSEAFEMPISTAEVPALLRTLSAEECAVCHKEFYEEWSSTMHSQAWTDPYFQTDWNFDRAQHICKNCHAPIDRQQEHRILGYRDRPKWNPILEPNPDFDAGLQHEGVTCVACHLREGKILGPYGDTQAPHPVRKLADSNQVCVRCHVVGGDRWDTFFRFPPCGTVAEIQSTPLSTMNSEDIDVVADYVDSVDSEKLLPKKGGSGEVLVPDTARLGCVQCHMPLTERPLIEGGKVRPVRRHLWRGGHDPEMVKQGLDIQLKKTAGDSPGKQQLILTITNVGAAHYLPTGTPDRFLTVEFRIVDKQDNVLKEQIHKLKRTVMWRPFIIDLWDTRLPRWQPRSYRFEFSTTDKTQPAAIDVTVRYHLMDLKRHERIKHKSVAPISYPVFQERVPIGSKDVE